MLNNLIYTTSIQDGINPYRKGTFKHVLFQWSLEQKQFTREEFLKAVIALKEENGVVSKMKDEVLNKAWWNEFKNKHKVFVSVE